MVVLCKFVLLMTAIMVVVDHRVLQQFAKETVQVQGNSAPIPAGIAKTTSDGNLVGIVKFISR